MIGSIMHSETIEKAIHKASILHRDQVRKGEDELPYITHLFSVFTILAGHTKDEDVLISGLLHDTLEDTHYTPEELEQDFGARVREIVEGVTEKKEVDGKKLEWGERKKAYIEGLRNASKESLMVAAADKTHNFRSILNEFGGKKQEFSNHFSLEDRVKFYGTIVEVISERLGDIPLVQTLRATYDEYEAFLTN